MHYSHRWLWKVTLQTGLTPLFSVSEAKIDNNKNLKSIQVTAALRGNAGLQQLQLSSPQGSCIPLPPCQKAASPHTTTGQWWEPSPPLRHLQEEQKQQAGHLCRLSPLQ